METRMAFQVARVRGIPIRIHVTFVIVLPLLAYAFGQRFVEAARLAGVSPAQISGPPWLWGLGVALGLFGSVLVHELAHSLYAVRQGAEVRSITLLMIGGVAELASPVKGEAAMALAGPATSLALGAIFAGLSRLATAAALPSASFALFYLGQLNLVLCAFNLLPAFPMDGGRVLRGVLARRMGPVRATRIAARLGRVFALLFAVVGFLDVNVMLLVISLFVFVGAEAELRRVIVEEALGDVRVRDVMSRLDTGAAASEPLLEVAARMVRERRAAYPVADGGRLVGLVTAGDVRRFAPEVRDRVLVRDAMRPPTAVDAGARLADVLPVLARAAPELAVLDGERLVGTLSQADVALGLELRELGAPAPAAGGDPAGSVAELRRGEEPGVAREGVAIARLPRRAEPAPPGRPAGAAADRR